MWKFVGRGRLCRLWIGWLRWMSCSPCVRGVCARPSLRLVSLCRWVIAAAAGSSVPAPALTFLLCFCLRLGCSHLVFLMAESEPRGEGMTAPPPRAEHEVGDRATDPGIYPMENFESQNVPDAAASTALGTKLNLALGIGLKFLKYILVVIAQIFLKVAALCGKQAVNANQALQDVYQNVMARVTLRRSADLNPEELPGHTNSRASLRDILPPLDVGNEGNKDLEAENRALKQALVILTKKYNDLTKKYNDLTKKHDDLTKKHDEDTKKHNVDMEGMHQQVQIQAGVIMGFT